MRANTSKVSSQPRKQRKAMYDAPLHMRHARLNAHLGEALLVKYNRRSFPIVKGDTVKVMRGAFRGHEDKIASVDLKIGKVTVEGVTTTKADGTKKARPVDPSNLLITRLNLTDPLRRDRILRTGKVDAAKREELRKELDKEAKAQKAEIEKFKKELEEREAKEKAEKGETEAKVDPVTQKPILAPKEEEKAPAHAGGEHLEKSREELEKTEKKEEK